MDYSKFYSLDAFNFMRSPVRDIFKAVDLSSIHSFAGGYPSADTFPLEKIEELTTTVVEKYGARAFRNFERRFRRDMTCQPRTSS